MADCLTSTFDYATDSSILAQGNYPQHKCWRPHPGIPLSRSLGNYKPLKNVARVLHFQDYEKVFNKKAIIPYEIRNDSHSVLPTGFKGSWFGVPESGEESNWYGNVSCKVDFQDLIEKFKPRCYFIEIVQYRSVSAPRLLLTTQEIPDDVNIIEYNPFIYGGPWFRDESGANYYLRDGRLHKRIDLEHPYELEFLLVLSREEYRRLFKMCAVDPVNHEDATMEEPRKCKKYRSGLRKDVCPTPWKKLECEEVLCDLHDANCDLYELSDESSHTHSDSRDEFDEFMLEYDIPYLHNLNS